jgi:hypothetical protein
VIAVLVPTRGVNPQALASALRPAQASCGAGASADLEPFAYFRRRGASKLAYTDQLASAFEVVMSSPDIGLDDKISRASPNRTHVSTNGDDCVIEEMPRRGVFDHCLVHGQHSRRALLAEDASAPDSSMPSTSQRPRIYRQELPG